MPDDATRYHPLKGEDRMGADRLDWERTERTAMMVLLSMLVVYSIVCGLFALSVVWQLPAIFAALVVILKVLLEIREKLGEAPTVSMEYYGTNAEFYSEMWSQVSRARRSVAATYIRKSPPTRFLGKDATAYFSNVLDWAREDPARRTMRRMIAVPDTEMRTWATAHETDTNGMGNYEVRVLDWHVRADSLNMCVIDADTDDATVFLAFSGETEQGMTGLRIRGSRAVAYFAHYYNQLWSEAEPLSEFISRTS
jgi:hypothetical protein